MPDADGRIRPVVMPGAPWCATCKLVNCICPPASKRLPGYVGFDPDPRRWHPHCGTPQCCGTCDAA